MIDKMEMMQVAMQIILKAGNGRTEIKKALTAMEESRFQDARELLDAAQEEIHAAHRAQTELIQSESRGEDAEFSILFIHSQDTLMTIKSEWNIADQLLGITQRIDQRLTDVEKACG